MRMQCAIVVVLLSAASAMPGAAQSSPSSQPPSTSCKTTVINVTGQYLGNVTPTGINASDTVVGSVLNERSFENSGFTWSNGNSTIYNYPGALATSLNGINDAGTSVGWYANNGAQKFGFLLTSSGTT